MLAKPCTTRAMFSLYAIPGTPIYVVALVKEANMLIATTIQGIFRPARK